MNIKFISNKSYPEFEVYEENKMIIHIKVDLETDSFRIKCKDKRRVFFISDEIIKKNKITFLLNEYSQQLGSLIENKLNNNLGEIEIERMSYSYEINDDFSKEINLFEHNSHHQFLSCKIESGNLSLFKKDYLSYLLFSLGWFNFLTQEQPNPVQLAIA